jgi:hypothetical protein
MKKVIMNEALSPLDKMKAANNGTRKQNWGACSDQKLKDYYKICLENQLTRAILDAEAEIKNRDHFEWLAPRAVNPILINITTSDAQYIWNERKTCHRIIQTALDLPSSVGDTYRPSEFLLKAYVLIKCMDQEVDLKMIEIWIKNHMKDQPYYSVVPTLANRYINHANVADQIAAAVKNVNYS